MLGAVRCCSERLARAGTMDELLQAVLAFGFDQMGLHSVEAQIDPDHARSRRVLERLGFQEDGRLRENYRDHTGRFTDTGVFTLLSREFVAGQL